MSGLYREELGEGHPSHWAEKFRVGNGICQVGTKGWWENLGARSALMCEIHTPLSLVLGFETKGKYHHRSLLCHLLTLYI